MTAARRRIRLLLLLVPLFASACGGRERLYPGSPRGTDQIALLTNQQKLYGERVFIVRVDDANIQPHPFGCELELLPGPHVVEFGYAYSGGHSLENAVLPFEAEAGHRYEARANSSGPQSGWAFVFGGQGHWAASIFDITLDRTVSPPPTP